MGLCFNKITIIIIISMLFADVQAEAGWKIVEEADQTIVKIQSNFGSCTGTRISHHGHILTARHCFNACLISKEYVDSQQLFPEYGWRSPNLYTFSPRKEAKCRVKIDDTIKQVDILAASDGFMIPSEQAGLYNLDRKMYLDFLSKNYLHNGDFAIVQEQGPIEGQKCRQVKLNSSIIDSDVFYLGYPAPSEGRPEGKNSNGTSLHMSKGKVVSSILLNPCLRENSNKSALTLKYDRVELLLSTVDVIPGASGAALLDYDNGRILGLINSSFSQGVNIYSQYCSGSAVAVKIDHILQFLTHKFDRAVVNKMFNCKD